MRIRKRHPRGQTEEETSTRPAVLLVPSFWCTPQPTHPTEPLAWPRFIAHIPPVLSSPQHGPLEGHILMLGLLSSANWWLSSSTKKKIIKLQQTSNLFLKNQSVIKSIKIHWLAESGYLNLNNFLVALHLKGVISVHLESCSLLALLVTAFMGKHEIGGEVSDVIYPSDRLYLTVGKLCSAQLLGHCTYV